MSKSGILAETIVYYSFIAINVCQLGLKGGGAEKDKIILYLIFIDRKREQKPNFGLRIMENSKIKTIESTTSKRETIGAKGFVDIGPFSDGDLVTDDKDMQVIAVDNKNI